MVHCCTKLSRISEDLTCSLVFAWSSITVLIANFSAHASHRITAVITMGGADYENYSETSKTYDDFREPIDAAWLKAKLSE